MLKKGNSVNKRLNNENLLETGSRRSRITVTYYRWSIVLEKEKLQKLVKNITRNWGSLNVKTKTHSKVETL